MDSPRPRRALRALAGRVAVAGILAAGGLMLAGCQGSPAPATSPSASGRSTTSSAPSSTPRPTSTATPAPTPVTLTCDRLLDSDQLTRLVPRLVPAPGFTPQKGSNAARAVDRAGVACGYTNPSTGDTVAVSVARPAASELTALKNRAVTRSHVVPTYGVPPKVMGYFTVEGGEGVAEAFAGDYWVVAASKDFIEPGDAGQVIADALANLPD